MEKELERHQTVRVHNLELETGVDELNLAEFPLASVSDRFLDGTKTVVFEDTVFCQQQKKHLPRRLTISGSDRYGLPTAKDDDVLLACIQLSRLDNFASPEVRFSRYEMLKLLRWKDDSRNYERIANSLRRWKGLTVYSDRAFYDHKEKSWVNRDFGIFDNLTIYRREVQQGSSASGSSRFVWNEVMYQSFLSGYLKRLDWSLYTSLESPVAKRLYRFLDKRFYHGNKVEIDLRELAVQKVRLSEEYNTAQMKRVLLKGIEELESRWDLKRTPPEKRFVKEGKGQWVVILERKAKKAQGLELNIGLPIKAASDQMTVPAIPAATTDDLAAQLVKRGIGPASADELASGYPAKDVRAMIELFDWYNQRGNARGPGFLVGAIKKPSSIVLPRRFETSDSIAAKKQAEKNRISSRRDLKTKRERMYANGLVERQQAFSSFWEKLNPEEQERFETKAIDQADPTKKSGYLRSMGKNPSPVFEQYRLVILRDHFERSAQGGTASPDDPRLTQHK